MNKTMKKLIRNIKIIINDLREYLIEYLFLFNIWVKRAICNLNSGRLKKQISNYSREIRSFIHDEEIEEGYLDKEKLDIIVHHNELVRLENILNELSEEKLLSREEKNKFREKAKSIYDFCVRLDKIRTDKKYKRA